MNKKYNLREEFILNPNCSELISAIHFQTHQEFLDVLEELSRIAEVSMYLYLGYDWTESESISLDVQKDLDGITRLIFYPSFNYEINVRLDAYTEVSAKIPVPVNYLKLENKVLDYDPDKESMIFTDVALRLRSAEQGPLKPWASEALSTDPKDFQQDKRMLLRFKEARLDLSRLQRRPARKGSYYFAIEVDDLEFTYDSLNYNDFLGYCSFDGSLLTSNVDLDYELYPTLRKIFRSISERFKTHFSSYDGGSSKYWEEWCTTNFPEYFIKMEMSSTHEDGTFYFLPVKTLPDFKALIEDFYSTGMKTVIPDENMICVESGKIEDLIFEEFGAYLIYKGEKFNLESIRVVSKQLDLNIFRDNPEKLSNLRDSFKIFTYPKGEPSINSIKRMTFYIYVSGENRWIEDETNEKFFAYLETHSKIVEI